MWDDNIKVDIKKSVWIVLAQDRDRCRASVDTLTKRRVQ
jgi:hypothetical protein